MRCGAISGNPTNLNWLVRVSRKHHLKRGGLASNGRRIIVSWDEEYRLMG